MSDTLANLNAAVLIVLQDKDAKLGTTTNINRFIQKSAVQTYSKHRPYRRIKDLSASGSYDYEINSTTFTGWVTDFSNIRSVEYPAGQYQVPNIIPREEWMIYEDATKTYLRFLEISPTSGYTIRVIYMTPHSVPDTGASTIYGNDEEAFCHLAASYCAGALANWYGEASNSTIGADVVNYRDKSDVWAARAKDSLKRYIEHMFPSNVEAGMAMKEFDTIYGELGYTRLTHVDWSR